MHYIIRLPTRNENLGVGVKAKRPGQAANPDQETREVHRLYKQNVVEMLFCLGIS
jgi:hypothetical protein